MEKYFEEVFGSFGIFGRGYVLFQIRIKSFSMEGDFSWIFFLELCKSKCYKDEFDINYGKI